MNTFIIFFYDMEQNCILELRFSKKVFFGFFDDLVMSKESI